MRILSFKEGEGSGWRRGCRIAGRTWLHQGPGLVGRKERAFWAEETARARARNEILRHVGRRSYMFKAAEGGYGDKGKAKQY